MSARTLMRVTDVAAPAQSCVYLIRGAGLTKIGRTSKLDQRLRDIRAMCPVPIELVLTIDNTWQPSLIVESWLHYAFEDHRRHGEWFLLPADWEEIVAKTLEDLAPGWEDSVHLGESLA